MKKEDCFELGIIKQTHGLEGGMTVYFDVDYPDDYLDLESVFIEINYQLVPYFVEDIKPKGNDMILYLEDIDTVEKARQLKGCKLYLPLKELSDLEPDTFYYHDLIGFDIIDTTSQQNIGKLESIVEMPAQYLAQTTVNGKEVLIPLVQSLISHINEEAKQIYLHIPEGLIDVYLEDTI